ncbi:MAG: hypothetical protein L6R48_24365, partial [Planctomycetes bacterium]|nr:hypothetical protein [Planctomycetota bacterium]
MRLQRPVRTLLALALAGSAWAAEPATAAATASTPWSIQAPAGAVREQDGAIVMTGRAEEAWSAAQPLAAGPGSDAAPLVVRALLLAGGRHAQAVHPSLLQLGWGDDQAVAVGLPVGDGKDRRGWAAWRAGAAHGEAMARSQVPAGQPIHLRLVLTSRVIAAETSRDGVAWERVLELPRSGALAGAPTRLAVGRGWGAAAAERRKGDRSEDSWRFAGVAVQALPSALAADLLKDYRKPDGYDAVRAEDEARGRVLRWRLRGPVPHPARAAGAADAAEDPAGDGWVDAELPPGGAEDQLDVGRLLGAKPNGHYLAAVRIPSPVARWEQLQIEGVREFTVLVDGMPLLRSAPEQRGPVRVAVPLRAGTTTVLVRLTATPGGVALLGMTRADADPRPRIAWLGRIALDFPGEAEAQAEGR